MLLASGSFAETAHPEAGAVPAGFFYSSDAQPGITRVRRGNEFAYRDSKGRWIKDEAQLARIRKLAIPPAYESVWICASPNGHLQATGRDARGRKQYRYHPTWREERDTGKFERLLQFSKALPGLRRKVQRQLAQKEHSRELVLATIVRLLDTTLIRVGNDQYARENGSFGLTTLRNRHVRIQGESLRLSFRGKSGVRHDVEVKDPRVLRVVRRCLHLPGQELFQYRGEDGELHTVGSGDVNDFLDSLCPEHFTAKDFRTWHGSVLALDTLRKFCGASGESFTLKQLLAEVAHSLGNTPAVCRKAYIHPGVLELGMRLAALKGHALFDEHVPAAKGGGSGLSAAEKRLVALLATLR
ncbi:DNA topoisomerase IB [Caenimonas terrae]|uniref:DNA topoisomerase n=1 Tax=Caenimonas terrae TaxID=696074 RepID=A0ABW0NM30_9BURK